MTSVENLGLESPAHKVNEIILFLSNFPGNVKNLFVDLEWRPCTNSRKTSRRTED